MRVALISTPFVRVPPDGYGGTERFCAELVDGLCARGHEVTLFATGDSKVPCRLRALYETPRWPPTWQDDLRHCAWAFDEIARGRYDVAHLNGAIGIPLCNRAGCPVVHTIHYVRSAETSRIFAAHPDVVYVGLSRSQLDGGPPLARSLVIHHGLSANAYPASAADEGYLLHLGRYAHDKGTHLAIDIALAAHMPIRLAGRANWGDTDYYAQQIRPRLRDPDVVDVGETAGAAKLALLQGARALLCPLQWEEPFGLVAIEAMLCGTPVLGFRRGSFPEIVEDGVTGFLAAPGDLEALARAAEHLVGFDRARCARRARERFSADTMVSAYASLYASLA